LVALQPAVDGDSVSLGKPKLLRYTEKVCGGRLSGRYFSITKKSLLNLLTFLHDVNPKNTQIEDMLKTSPPHRGTPQYYPADGAFPHKVWTRPPFGTLIKAFFLLTTDPSRLSAKEVQQIASGADAMVRPLNYIALFALS
jgi:hypothetical protein